eukprot:5319817-Alexandrium_andersonii.AAC.1
MPAALARICNRLPEMANSSCPTVVCSHVSLGWTSPPQCAPVAPRTQHRDGACHDCPKRGVR